MTDDTAHDLIPGYARANLPVLPLHSLRDGQCTCRNTSCHSPAKHPITTHGKDDATTDLGQIAEWFARYPGCNWGVRPPVGVIVLDVDPRNGGDVELGSLESAHGRLPKTLSARTGGGGQHIWLMHNGPARGRLCDGVDVKTHSGYLVAPPSIHATGGVYRWTEQAPAAPAPRWVRTMLNPPLPRYEHNDKGGGIDALILFVAASTEGERNRRLYWAACRAYEKGIDPTPLVDAAVGVGLNGHDATATVRSAEHAPPRKAR